MNIKLLAKKNFFIIVLISATYLLYASIFLKPWSFRNFSLVDDGQVLVQSSSYLEDCFLHLKCSKFVDQTFELGTNRFRPSYWLINNTTYEIFRNDAQLHHLFRVYVVGLVLALLLTLILLDLKVGWIFTLTAVLAFITNYSFTENIIRLGTNEPYQVIFLAIFSLFYLNRERIEKRSKNYLSLLLVLLIWTILIKENNIAVLPVILATEFVFNKPKLSVKAFILTAVPSLIFFLGTFLTKRLPSTISVDIPVYTSNYIAHPLTILGNSINHIRLLLNSMSPFLKLSLFFFPLLFVVKTLRKLLKVKKFFYWTFFGLSFTAILFPWRYVLERYQLVAIFGLTVVIAFLFDKVLFSIRKVLLSGAKTHFIYGGLFNIISFLVVMNLFFKGFPLNLAKSINYREWFSVFTEFESDQVRAIAKYNDQKVYINSKNNINNWELLYELPIHLRFLYRLNPNIEILTSLKNLKGYIFSRSSFDSVVEIDEIGKSGYKLVSTKAYHIDQIDSIKFREQFAMRPLQTILNPPLSKDHFEYYWEIRKIE